MMGNPWSYRGHNLEWSRIRLLTKWDDIEMEYNASGMRTRKGDTYYELDGNNIISETTNGNTIRYYYGNGGIVGFRYNGNRYYYEKNLQGDIIAIYDESGNKVASYIYDAWGNCTIENDVSGVRIGEINPFRYRGYYYDSDIGLYYLKSRYYDAAIGRFINADSINYLGANGNLCSFNLFAYCVDNPVMQIDETGCLAFPGQIHNIVVYYVAALYGLNTEQTIYYKEKNSFGKRKWGRADLISENGEVWDVKRNDADQIAAGVEQVKKYVNNEWKDHSHIGLSVGGYIEPGKFTVSIGWTVYHIEYEYAGNGIIAYDYEKETDWDKIKEYASYAVAAGLTIGAAYLVWQSGGALAPVLIPILGGA